jgi:hypothetical protein
MCPGLGRPFSGSHGSVGGHTRRKNHSFGMRAPIPPAPRSSEQGSLISFNGPQPFFYTAIVCGAVRPPPILGARSRPASGYPFWLSVRGGVACWGCGGRSARIAFPNKAIVRIAYYTEQSVKNFKNGWNSYSEKKDTVVFLSRPRRSSCPDWPSPEHLLFLWLPVFKFRLCAGIVKCIICTRPPASLKPADARAQGVRLRARGRGGGPSQGHGDRGGGAPGPAAMGTPHFIRSFTPAAPPPPEHSLSAWSPLFRFSVIPPPTPAMAAPRNDTFHSAW